MAALTSSYTSLLLCVTALTQLCFSASQSCSSGGNDIPVTKYTPSTIHKSAYLQIFPDYKLTCSGTLTQWDYIAYGSLKPVYLDIWRTMAPPNDNLLKLVGSTRVVPIKSDLSSVQTYVLKPSESISVKVGDMVGMHSVMTSDAENNMPIPYLDEVYSTPTDASTTLLWQYSHPIIAQLGGVVSLNSTTSGYKRQPALRAYVAGKGSISVPMTADQDLAVPKLQYTDPNGIIPVVAAAAPETSSFDAVPLNKQNVFLQPGVVPTTLAPGATNLPGTTALVPLTNQPAGPNNNNANPTTTQAQTYANAGTTAVYSQPPNPQAQQASQTAAASGGATTTTTTTQPGSTTTSSMLNQAKNAANNALNTVVSYAKGLYSFNDYTVNGTPVWVITTIVAVILGVVILILLILLCYACCCRKRVSSSHQAKRPHMVKSTEVQTDYSADFQGPVTQEKSTNTKRTVEAGAAHHPPKTHPTLPPPPTPAAPEHQQTRPFIEMFIGNNGHQAPTTHHH